MSGTPRLHAAVAALAARVGPEPELRISVRVRAGARVRVRATRRQCHRGRPCALRRHEPR